MVGISRVVICTVATRLLQLYKWKIYGSETDEHTNLFFNLDGALSSLLSLSRGGEKR